MKDHVDQIKNMISTLRSADIKTILTRLDLNKCERNVEKLGSFSIDCQECEQHLLSCKNHFIQLKSTIDMIEETDIKQHKQLIHQTVSHLQKKHKLLPEWMSLGVVFGFTFFNNIASGIPRLECVWE